MPKSRVAAAWYLLVFRVARAVGFPAAIALLAVVGTLCIEPEALRFERALFSAEPWRILTAHFTHLSPSHLALNLLALGVIWAILGSVLRVAAWFVALVTCAAVVTGGIYLFNPEIEWYVGLSGVLHGLFSLGALAGLSRAPGFHALLLMGVLSKVGWEQWAGVGYGPADLIGGAVIVDAHLYGMVAGFACLPLVTLLRTTGTRSKRPRT